MTGYAVARAVSKDAGVDRVVVGGKDITWFRADGMGPFQPTFVPGYTLIEPFAYGSSQPLVIPRTNSNFGDRPGHGDLAWLKEGASVKYQRLTDAGLVTDYRGRITALRATAREWVAEIAGEMVGPANMIDRPPALIRKRFDVGNLVTFGVEGLGFKLATRFPVTGVETVDVGGTTEFSSLSMWIALARTAGDAPWTLMPTVWGHGTWELGEKDTTTPHLTAFADGSRTVLDLVDDMSEKPNTIYGTCVTPDGLRCRGAEYPGFFQGEAAPYPFSDHAHDFGEGTTNADTDTGDGITIMARKLSRTGNLADSLSRSDVFMPATGRAVNRLKAKAGLPEDGMMTFAAWQALWDLDVVGYSSEGARIAPVAQHTKVRRFNYSSTGDVIGTNPDFDPTAQRVDRTIDFGVCEEWMMRAFAHALIVPPGARRWNGTVTMNNCSAFSGERDSDYADAVNANPQAYVADMMVARDIRPGMNIWLPYFDGGTLLHISGVDVNGTTVTLTVSTAALDIFDLTQALQNNADSKRNIYREWRQTLHGAKAPNNFTQRDKMFGVLDRDVPLTGGQWNVVPIIMGQSGSVSQAYINLQTPTEFFYAVFVKKVTGTWMDAHVGHPRHIDSDGLTVWEQPELKDFYKNRDLIIVEGEPAQPCGYGWQAGYGASGARHTGVELTGDFLSHATWTYVTPSGSLPVVYLAIWPDSDCSLAEGRIFDALEDDVT